MNKLTFRDSHHLLHTRASYESSRSTKALREHPSLIFNMPRVNHELLHSMTPPVALLGHYAAVGTLARYNPTFDPTKDIDNLCLSMDKATKGDRFHQLERDLAGVAIEGIQLQKPLIYYGITNSSVIL